ncbi:MAG: YgiQ family radical SAM protein [Methanocorpusculum sp.]|nr:YgiQ family radical SAM protein [Methanocorpusculum sp.]
MPNTQPEYVPITREELKKTGVKKPDIVLVCADAYVDHPSFAAALISRMLIWAGFSVAIISQPDWKDKEGNDFKKFGEPNLFFAVVPGMVDPMINAYTPALKKRSSDVYSPGGKLTRPERVTIVYSNQLHRLFPQTPIVIGGVEASLRRFAHYDYWSDTIRRSILADAPASLLVYGMGEYTLIEIAKRLRYGKKITEIRDIPGTCWEMSVAEFKENPPEGIILPAYPDVCDKQKFALASKLIFSESGILIQRHPKTVIVQNPAQKPLTTKELDRIYDLPYTRKQHPLIKETVPALAPVQFSITTHRGCLGSCSFCSIALHQGRQIVSRSDESVLKEAERISKMKEFKGVISDVGGPSANMYGCSCKKWKDGAPCKDKSCLTCKNLKNGTERQLELLRRIRKIPKVKHVFISSGIRYDLIPDDEVGDEYIRSLVNYYISGHLKVAPEHISERVTHLMNKPGKAEFDKFRKRFDSLQKGKEKKQYLVPYLMSSHPGCRIEDMVGLALYLRENDMYTEQVQDFTPSPMTLSTAMYYTGLNPISGDKVYVPLGSEKRIQRALLQWKDWHQYDYVVSGLLKAGRSDLIGDLVPNRGIPELRPKSKKRKK